MTHQDEIDYLDKILRTVKAHPKKVIGFIILCWAFVPVTFIVGEYFPLIPIGDRGTFGDMFGGINALFSGLAFGGIILTMILQNRDLQISNETLQEQRKELELTRQVLNEQRAEMAIQNQTMKKQQLETTFFNMLRQFTNIVNSMDIRDGSQNITGQDCFFSFAHEIHNAIQNLNTPEKEKQMKEHWWEWRRSDLAHYYRYIITIISFIQKSGLSAEEQQHYFKIFEAQLSDNELTTMLFYCAYIAKQEDKKNILSAITFSGLETDLNNLEERLKP